MDENRAVPMGDTNSFRKEKKLNEAAESYLTNKVYDGLITAENTFEVRKNAVNAIAENFSLSQGYRKKRERHGKFRKRDFLKRKLFNEAIYEIFYEALILDNNFKSRFEGNLRKLAEDGVEKLFKSGNLTYKIIEEDSSKVARELLWLCEEVATELALGNTESGGGKKFNIEPDSSEISYTKDGRAILNEIEPSPEDEEEEKEIIVEEFKKEKKEITGDVSEVVKDKVVEVVKSEQEQAKKDEEFIENINEETTEKDEEEEEEGEEKKEAEDEEDDSEEKETEKEGAKKEDTGEEKSIKQESVKIIPKKKLKKYSLFKSISMSVANKALKENNEKIMESSNEGEEEEENKINMDLVMAESITYYTFLETLYTLGLINPSVSELKTFANKLILEK